MMTKTILNGPVWKVLTVDDNIHLTNRQKKFMNRILFEMSLWSDPRYYESSYGFVKELSNYSKLGGRNLFGFYAFKPTRKFKDMGYNIRVIFRIIVNGAVLLPYNVLPSQKESNQYMEVACAANRIEVYKIELDNLDD